MNYTNLSELATVLVYTLKNTDIYADYKDENGIEPIIHETADELDRWCEGLTEKDKNFSKTITKVKASNANTLIIGSSGSGKAYHKFDWFKQLSRIMLYLL